LVPAFVCGRTAGFAVARGRFWMSEGSFHRVISEHLALAERNRRLERTMPLERYREPERQETDDVALPPPGEGEPSTEANVATPRRRASSWWDDSEERGLPAEFDWGDA
jgi:hypothetical protein